MTTFKGPPQFVPGPDSPSAWREYRDSFKIYAVAANLEAESVARQRATFLHILGPAGRRIFNTLPIVETEENQTLTAIYQAFDNYYEPYKNVTYLRYILLRTTQVEHQTFDEFFTDLKTKAQHCELGELTDDIITLMIVIGIRKEELRKRLLAIPALTLRKAVKICQAEEVSGIYAGAMSTPQLTTHQPTIANVDSLKYQRQRSHHRRPAFRPPYGGSSSQQRFNGRYSRPGRTSSFEPRTPNTRSGCFKCGNNHNSRPCPALSTKCLRCGIRGHWATRCRVTHSLNEEPDSHKDSSHYCPYEQQMYQDPPHRRDYHEEAPYDDDEFHDEDEEANYNTYSLTLQSAMTHDHTALPSLSLHALLQNVDEIYDELYLYDTPMIFKVDTGSQVNIITEKMYKSLPQRSTLQRPQFTVTAYSGHPVPIIGVTHIPCSSSIAMATFPFYITKEERTPILGAKASTQLGLIVHQHQPLSPLPPKWKEFMSDGSKNIDELTYPVPHYNHLKHLGEVTPQHIVEQYHACFDTIGQLPGEYSIELKPNATPSISAAHQIPHAYREPVWQELQRMQQHGVIVPVTEPSDWVHPMVVVPKASTGNSTLKVRICLDPRKLNSSIKRQPYPLPTSQEIFSQLKGSQVFTVLDAQSAFWQIKLTESSSRLCTFATPYGRFRFTRLPYGIVTGTEICQQAMRSLYPITEFPEIHISTDDFLIATPNMEKHRECLIKVLDRSLETGLKFNSTKMQLAVPKIQYLGNIISASGIQIDPAKVSAICSLPPPVDKSALQRFLGMINYVARFIPDANRHTAPLRTLLKKEAHFQWEIDHQQHYDQLKILASTAPVLAFFDPQAPITLSVDASQIGAGAVLMQHDHPVEYASTSFNATQCRYAQIEKEMLAIVFACEHFRYYGAGTNVTVHTDHNPLIGIMKKPLHLISPRLQRLLMRLFRYQIKLIYVPGTKLHIADMLSRAPQTNTLINTDNLEGPHTAVYAITTLPIKDQDQQKLATEQDQTLNKIMELVKNGWPQTVKALAQELKPYWAYQSELHVVDNLLYRGSTLVIPTSLRRQTMTKIHSTHQGINSCLAKAKVNVFWPTLTQDLTHFIQSCATCNQRAPRNMKMRLTPHELPNLPWQVAGMDLFKCGSQNIILLVDYFSKYIEAKELSATNTQAVMRFLDEQFSRHGTPQKIISDNGPPFNSSLMNQFMLQWGVQHITSSPYYAQSNGMAERAIQTIKNSLVKAKQEGKGLQQVLMEYRVTPKANLPSPTELCMGRRIRTPLTTTVQTLEPHYPLKGTRNQLKQHQDKMTRQYNEKPTKNLPPLKPGQAVRYMAGHRDWQTARILTTGPEPHSYRIKTTEGQSFRRTRTHLRASREETLHNYAQGRYPQRKEFQYVPLSPKIQHQWLQQK